MSSRSTVRYTYQDYLAIPEDSSRRHEIVDGELFVTPAPRFRHQRVVGNLLRILMDLAAEHELGEVVPGPITVRLYEEGVVEPEVRRDTRRWSVGGRSFDISLNEVFPEAP